MPINTHCTLYACVRDGWTDLRNIYWHKWFCLGRQSSSERAVDVWWILQTTHVRRKVCTSTLTRWRNRVRIRCTQIAVNRDIVQGYVAQCAQLPYIAIKNSASFSRKWKLESIYVVRIPRCRWKCAIWKMLSTNAMSAQCVCWQPKCVIIHRPLRQRIDTEQLTSAAKRQIRCLIVVDVPLTLIFSNP